VRFFAGNLPRLRYARNQQGLSLIQHCEEKMTHPMSATIALPDWWNEAVPGDLIAATAEERMSFTIGLAGRNVAEETGGPFGGAVFESQSGRLIAAGVNLVVASSMAMAHAEMVAITMASLAIGSHDLAQAGETQLVASTEPCAMCLGAVGWSGVTSLMCGARDEDARAVGFDEGPKPSHWIADLESSGISVTTDVLRGEAARVLVEYAESGGIIYNGRAALEDGSSI
jgi:tRNA(Arg) A34 adenosine deaminase TadA